MPHLDLPGLKSTLADAGLPQDLVNALLDEFAEARRRHFLGDLGPQAVNGGRFSEAAIRILEWETTGSYTPIGSKRMKVDDQIRALERLPSASASDSVRLHIPRALRVIYDVRNGRNTAHRSDGIDPNKQDASLIVAVMSWVVAEFVRLHHAVTADQAQAVIDALVTREVPLIQEVDGFPRVLKTLAASDHCLVLLYWFGEVGTTREVLSNWLPVTMRANLPRTLRALHDKHRVHFADPKATILAPGIRYVEESGLLVPA